MELNGRLLKKTFLSLLIANSVSMVFTILCFLIDSIVIGQFLGTDAASAAGLVQPVTLLINTLGMLLGPGLSVVCTRYIGKAQTERVDQVFSIVMIAIVASFFLLSAGMFFAAPAVAGLLGRGAGEEITRMTADYMRGYALGLIPTRLCMTLMGLMMIDNDQRRAMLSMFVTLAADVVFDLLNVLVFHGGMWGMALATSLSQLLGLITILTHFRRKDRVLHFTARGLRAKDLGEVVLYGVPNMISLGGQTLRGLCFNAFLLSLSGSGAVAALYVSNSAVSVLLTIMLGLFMTATTMSSLLYGEEDRTGLVLCAKLGLRISVIAYAVIAALMLFLARPLAGMFLKTDVEEELLQSARFIRVMGLQALFLAMSQCLSGAYQGMRRLKLNYFISAMREGVLPIASSLLLGMLLKMRGFEIGFVVSGVLSVLLFVVIPWVKNRRFPTSLQDLLMIPDDFGARPEETYESAMRTMEDVMKTSQEVMEFCRARNADPRIASRLSLFVEEMAGNTVTHGFTKKRGGCVDLRLVYREDEQVIRLRDDGRPFDPVRWLERNHPEDPLSGAGIRIIVKLASEVRYIPAMGLNNLMIKL